MTDLKLSKKLNFVIPLTLGDGSTVYVHCAPIGKEAYETYFEVFGKTYTQIYMGGYGMSAGPLQAKLIMKKVAEGMGMWDGLNGVKDGLFGEIHRLTNVVLLTPGKGWGTIPYETAVKQGMFDEDDFEEVENRLAYFTVASRMHPKAELRPILNFVARTLNAQVESLNCTAFAASLSTSTTEESTGENATPPVLKPSSIPV